VASNYGEEQTHRGGAPVRFRGRRGPGSGMAASVLIRAHGGATTRLGLGFGVAGRRGRGGAEARHGGGERGAAS
jgi:hypothetical protein